MSSRYDENFNEESGKSGKREPNWGRMFGIILIIVLAVVVLGGVLVNHIGNSIISKLNYVNDQDVQKVAESDLPEEAIQEVSTEEAGGKLVSSEELNQIQKKMQKVDDTVQNADDENTYTLLLAGVDRRDKSWNGNSDSMMLVTLNYAKKRVSIISLMRDTYVAIPDVGYAKLNNAYARGGGPLLCDTISENYNINLTDYAAVDFEDMITIVDALGGVDLEWTAAEIKVANGYMMDMCNMLGREDEDHSLPEEDGVYHCDGIQTVAYARNRYVGNSDYARTERQRYVISQIINEVKNMSITEVTSFVTDVLPLITTNIKTSRIWELMGDASEILTDYSIVEDRVPYDGMYEIIYVDGQDMLVPEWEDTITQMHETMYGDGSISDNSDNDRDNRLLNNSTINDDYYELLTEMASEAEAHGTARTSGTVTGQTGSGD